MLNFFFYCFYNQVKTQESQKVCLHNIFICIYSEYKFFSHKKNYYLFILSWLLYFFLLWVKFICLTFVQNTFCLLTKESHVLFNIRFHYIFLINGRFSHFKIQFVISCIWTDLFRDYWSNGKTKIISTHCISILYTLHTKQNNACIHGLYSV